MNLRGVYSNAIVELDGTARPGDVVKFRLERVGWDLDAHVLPSEKSATIQEDGSLPVTQLWASQGGGRNILCILPNGTTFRFTLPPGDDDISLETLHLLYSSVEPAVPPALLDLFGSLTDPELGAQMIGYVPAGISTPQTVRDKLLTIKSTTDHPTFAAALGAVETETLTVNRVVSAPSNTTVPATVALRFERGGRIEVPAGVTLTIEGPIEAGKYQIFSGDGSVRSAGQIHEVYPEWFGAGAGDNDAALMSEAITFAWGGTVVLSRAYTWDELSISGVPAVRLRGEAGATVTHFGDTVTETLITTVDVPIVQVKGITWDLNEMCARLFNGTQSTMMTGDERRGVTFTRNTLANGKQWTDATDRAVAIRTEGDWSLLDVAWNVVRNFYSVEPERPISRGVLCAKNPTTNGFTRILRVVFNDFISISPANDGDAIQYITADPPVNGIAFVTGNYFENCAKRSGKFQGAHVIFTENDIYRSLPPLTDENEDGPGVEVVALRGGGTIKDNRGYYEIGAKPPMWCSVNSAVWSPTIVEGNVLNSADATEGMTYFGNIAAIGDAQNNNVVFRNNEINFPLQYLLRIRPEAQSSSSFISIDHLLVDGNRAREYTTALIALERSGTGNVNVRGSIVNNEHYGPSVPAVAFNYTNVDFDLTWFENNGANIKWFANSSGGGSEFPIDYAPSQVLYHDRITGRGASHGKIRFGDTNRGNEALVCRVVHDGVANVFIKCLFHASGGSDFGDHAAIVDAWVINETAGIFVTYSHRFDSSYAGSWSVVRIDANTFELQKTAGSGSGSSTWLAIVEGATRIRKG